jgi:hypothetical protein
MKKLYLVPEEPTTEMLRAGVKAYETAGQGFLIGAYKAMLAVGGRPIKEQKPK